jgi:hypothetical protein
VLIFDSRVSKRMPLPPHFTGLQLFPSAAKVAKSHGFGAHNSLCSEACRSEEGRPRTDQAIGLQWECCWYSREFLERYLNKQIAENLLNYTGTRCVTCKPGEFASARENGVRCRLYGRTRREKMQLRLHRSRAASEMSESKFYIATPLREH